MNRAPGTPWVFPWRILLAAFALVTFLAVGWSLLLYFGLGALGRSITLRQAASGFGDWYIWLAISPLVVWLARRFPVEEERPWRGVTVHTGLGIVVGVAELALFTVYSTWHNRAILGYERLPPFFERFAETAVRWLPFALLIYVVIVTAVHAIEYHRRYREREMEAVRLENQLGRARLDALEMQLQPHFLFNTLNTIVTLTREHDVNRASGMMVRLADLLRTALDRTGTQEVLLAEELEFIDGYLALERERLEDRLCIERSFDSDAMGGLVPVMLLQPLVENAMRHAVSCGWREGRSEFRPTARASASRIVARGSPCCMAHEAGCHWVTVRSAARG